MKKENYYIYKMVNNEKKFVEVSGYTDTFDGIKIGFHKNENRVLVRTELSTGMSIGLAYPTKKTAIESIAPELITMVSSLLKNSESVKEVQERLKDFKEGMTND